MTGGFSGDIFDFYFPFNSISAEDKKILEKLYDKFIAKLPQTVQYKLNAGIDVGTFNTAQLWDITDKSDMIFFKYICNDPIELSQLVENHIAKCVISDKKNDE